MSKWNVKVEIPSDDDQVEEVKCENEAQFTNVWVKEEPGPPSPLDPLDPRFVVKEESSDAEIVPDFEVEIPIEYEEPKEKKTKRKLVKKRIYKKPTETLICDHCHYTTVYKRQLRLHFTTKHEKVFGLITCDMCDFSTHQSTNLWQHKALTHKMEAPQSTFNGLLLKEFQCEHCEFKTNSKWNLEQHQRKHDTKTFKCLFCEYETAYQHHYDKHTKTHKKKAKIKKFQCPLCEFKTAFKYHYDKHTKTHKDKSFFYKCDKCPFATKFSGHIQRHLAIIHKEISENDYFCKLCNYSTCSKKLLNRHVRENTKDTALKCKFEQCSFETFVRCELKRHKTTHFSEIYKNKAEKQKDLNDGVENVPNEPDISKNTTNNSCTDYTENILSNFTENFEMDNFESANESTQNTETDNAEPKEPETILAKYSSQPYLSKCTGKNKNTYNIDPKCSNILIPVIEAVSGDKRFLCQKCDYKSRYKAAVKRHYHRQHTGNKIRPYQCKNCDFTTKTLDSIAKHNKRSLSETAVKCYDPQCDYTTIFKCQMVVHQKTHYKYHCSKCPHSCRNKGELTRHYAVAHLGEGIKCRFCNFVGSRKDSVLVHETIHTGEKPIKCKYCDYSTVRDALLKIHMNKYHSEIKQKVTVINSEDLEDKIRKLQMFVPSLSEMKNEDGEKLKINDQRVSLSENRILLGDRIVRIEDKDKINQINEIDVVSLMGMVGYDLSKQNEVACPEVAPDPHVKSEPVE